MYICVCVCMCVCVRDTHVKSCKNIIYMCVFIYIYIYVCVCIYVYVYIYICVYIYMCVFIHMYVYIYIEMYIFIYVYVCMYIFIFMHMYVSLPPIWYDFSYIILIWSTPKQKRSEMHVSFIELGCQIECAWSDFEMGLIQWPWFEKKSDFIQTILRVQKN